MRVLFEVQESLCFHCGERMYPCRHRHDGYVGPREATLEHAVPRQYRMDIDHALIVLAHRSCNNKRSDRPLTIEQMERVRFISAQARQLLDEEYADGDTEAQGRVLERVGGKK